MKSGCRRKHSSIIFYIISDKYLNMTCLSKLGTQVSQRKPNDSNGYK